ncbi:hypothetical protein B0H17DRAFT_1151561 [Mycena rosella]|uniref:Peptidase M1 membrane alanine aminopeptidase domain-containing protein n=1 Tax=Mycena rosella TaxID=1033263 RepID=A0AAD7BJB4_MYCRO|nr:hypothetical protein B0H17DRAFT_1151561 [Mycena rosella]
MEQLSSRGYLSGFSHLRWVSSVGGDGQNCSEAVFFLGFYDEVLRMLSSLLEEDLFFKGVSLYLKERQFGNSVAGDLWDALSRASGMDVTMLMENWITKTGYPVITVTESPGGIDVRQNRFLESGIAAPKDDETIWTVPLNILAFNSDNNPGIDKSIFLSERSKCIALDMSKPFKLNASTVGFYRVHYDSDKLNKLALEAAKGGICDRVGLMDDAMALAKANLAKLSNALTLIAKLAGETKYYLGRHGCKPNRITLLNAWWENVSIYIFVPLVSDLGYEYPPGESSDTGAVRTLAIKCSVNAGDPGVVAELKSRFRYTMMATDGKRQ